MAFTPFDIWEEFGITEHLGGIRATQKLLETSDISAGEWIMDLGCGSGYTACLAAGKYQAKLVGVDINAVSISEARKRVERQGLNEKVFLVQADGHNLPFEQGVFDHVLVESMLVFGEPVGISRQLFRVLDSRGSFSANEITLLRPPANELSRLLNETMNVQAYDEPGWHQVFSSAGFTNISSKVFPIRVSDQLISHVKTDGLVQYASAVLNGILNPRMRRVFFTREMLTAGRKFMSHVGYGIYWGRKNN
jgi:ubiquinone/menaquinone biosynthesis C-methylase UbiE